ncbi:hypothetical protein J4X77_06615 [Escherichia coli]|mgnify:CR=1 FL=1|uniref:ECs1072 family phage-associated protein n=1 Tax=Enterobacteriaceae TaxID=543 RepID=UPI000A3C06D5|nr:MULTISPECIES: hypothetical protein [Enterobacteriaceae]EEW1992670.1 hypothetical protein [Escherichia coli]EJD6120012.1 hypothetical protein [Escherichia coli]EJD6187287.1 hypothetical protein [Escherichia coli]ELK0175864.1 hypothetical protein [Escherichia coli]ELV7629067.1 hypothetical protein [Escherichia coli]
MSNYSDLLQAIKLRVCQNNNIPIPSLTGSGSYQARQVWNRIAQIFTLECILAAHRNEYGSVFVPLENEKALHHIIFLKTKWNLAEIRTLSLNDSLFIIAEMFRSDAIPPDAKVFMESVRIPEPIAYPLEDFSDEDWDPKGNSVFLQSH